MTQVLVAKEGARLVSKDCRVKGKRVTIFEVLVVCVLLPLRTFYLEPHRSWARIGHWRYIR
jgi:hypothetical protein